MSAEQHLTKYENIPFSPTVESVVYAVMEDCIPSVCHGAAMDVFVTQPVIFFSDFAFRKRTVEIGTAL